MTLVELMVSISIVSIAGIALVALLIHSLRAWSAGSSNEAATSSATIALQKLSNDIRNGKAAVGSSGTLTVTFPRLMTDPLTNESVYDPSVSDPVTRSYFISNGNLVKQTGASVVIVTRDISSATFGATGGVVTVTLTSNQHIGSSTSTHQVKGRISLRNYRS